MAKCPICNGTIYFMEGIKTRDGSICSECAHIVSSPKDFPTSRIQAFWKANHTRWNRFTETKVLHSPESLYISIDETHRFFLFGRGRGNNQEKVVYSFDEVDSYEYITIKGETVTRKKGVLGRAIVGGLVAGAAGAVIGGVTAGTTTDITPDRKKIKVYLTTQAGKVQEISSNFPYPQGFTEFLDSCILGEVYGETSQPVTTTSAADELLKFKNLCDMGVISQEEFEAKKKQLLGL